MGNAAFWPRVSTAGLHFNSADGLIFSMDGLNFNADELSFSTDELNFSTGGLNLSPDGQRRRFLAAAGLRFKLPSQF